MILPSHASSHARQSRCNYSGEKKNKKRKAGERESGWKGRRIKWIVESTLRSVSMATPSLSGPFVLVNTSLQTALTSKWPVIDLRCQLRSREAAACPRKLPGLSQLSVSAVVWSSFPDRSRIAFWDLTFIWLQTETLFLFHGYPCCLNSPEHSLCVQIHVAVFFKSKQMLNDCFRLFVLSYSVYVQIYIEWLSSEAFLPTEGMGEQNPQSSFSANLLPKF